MSKVITTVYLDAEIIEHAKKNLLIESLSSYFEQNYYRDFFEISKLVEEIEHIEKKKHRLKSDIKELKKKKKEYIGKLSTREKDFILNEAPRRIKKFTFEGVYQFYKRNVELKDHDMTRRQFKLVTKLLTGESVPVRKR